MYLATIFMIYLRSPILFSLLLRGAALRSARIDESQAINKTNFFPRLPFNGAASVVQNRLGHHAHHHLKFAASRPAALGRQARPVVMGETLPKDEEHASGEANKDRLNIERESKDKSSDGIDALRKRLLRESLQQEFQGSFFSVVAGLAAEGGKLPAGIAEVEKLSTSGVMLRLAQIAEYDEILLRKLANMMETEPVAMEGLVLPWTMLSEHVVKLLTDSELESLPGCEKAAETLVDVLRIADASTGDLAAADVRFVAEGYGQFKRELQAAFKGLPSELRAAGKLELQEFLAMESILLIGLDMQLQEKELEMKQVAIPGAQGLILTPESTILEVSELMRIQETILRDAAELPQGELANSLQLSNQSMLASVDMFLEGFNLEGVPGGGNAARSLKQVKEHIEQGVGELTQADLLAMADNWGRARMELQAASKFSQLAFQRADLERAKDFVSFAEKSTWTCAGA